MVVLVIGTIALEFLEQVPYMDIIIVPIGGGGMCSGLLPSCVVL
jgi:threonine dehydratase